MDKMMRARERGAALLNLALALALGTSVVAGAFWVTSAGLQKARLEETVVLVQEVAGAIFAAYAHSADYSGLTEYNLYNMGVLPERYWRGYGLKSPMGDMDLRTRDIGGGCGSSGYCDNGFHVRVEDIDKTECRYLGIQRMGSRHFDTSVWNSSTGFRWINDWTSAEVAAACGDGDDTSVTYYFG